MNNVLLGAIGLKCLVCLDDITVHGKNIYDHNNKLIEVFELLKMHNLKGQSNKHEFLKRKYVYLEHVINWSLNKTRFGKKANLELKKLTNVQGIKLFWALSEYYRTCI